MRKKGSKKEHKLITVSLLNVQNLEDKNHQYKENSIPETNTTLYVNYTGIKTNNNNIKTTKKVQRR